MVSNPRLTDWQSLHQQLRGIAKRRAALDAEEARCLREADALRLWRRLGYVHMAEYLERELGYGPQVGAERLRVARELGEVPQTEAGLADGTLSYSAVRELSRIATADTEDEWLTQARGKNLRQIEAMVSGRKRGDRPSDPTDPKLVSRVVRLELLPEAMGATGRSQIRRSGTRPRSRPTRTMLGRCGRQRSPTWEPTRKTDAQRIRALAMGTGP